MRIESLRECIDLASTLNFTKTSENMFVTQPVLSKHIKNVEDELGVQLFIRTKRSVSLTEAGTLFIESAKRVIAEYDMALEELSALQRNASGVLKIGYLQGLIAHNLPIIQARFSVEFPQTEVQYIAYEFTDAFKAIEHDEVDLSVSFVPAGLDKNIYRTASLLEDEYWAVMDRRNPLTEHDSLGPEDFAGQTVALPAASFYTSDNEDIVAYLEPEKNDVRIEQQLRDINNLPIFAQSNDWVGISFHHLEDYYRGEIAMLPLRGFTKKILFGSIWKAARETPAMRRWAEIAQSVLASS